MMTDGDALAPGTRVEEFAIEQVLGAGGFGVTYLARDVELERQVAVKEYLPLEWSARHADGAVGPRSRAHAKDYRWGLERFLEEARTLARLDHPHIVRVYRVVKGYGTAYMVTEYVQGRSLAEELKAAAPWGERRVRVLLDALTSGLEPVHAAGLVHRDIKPANVMLRADRSPVLIDFGAARQAVGQQSRSVTAVLTPGYAPFEQYSTRGRQGPWTDIYALGAVAYVTLTGRVPDEAPDRMADDGLPSVSEMSAVPLSAPLTSAIEAALSVRSEDRPQSLSEWRSMLDEPAPVESAVSAPPRPSRRARFDVTEKASEPPLPPRWPWLYGTVALAAVVVGVIVWTTVGSIHETVTFLPFGATQSGNLTASGRDRWTFAAPAGESISVAVASEDFDTYLELYGPSGQTLAFDDDSGGDTDSLIGPLTLDSGAYVVVVRGYSENDAGRYSLTLGRRSGGSAISGVVTDITGGVLPGVTIDVSSDLLFEGDGIVFSDGDGRYSIGNLGAGIYSATFVLPGFTTQAYENLALGTDETLQVDPVLEVGSVDTVIRHRRMSGTLGADIAQRPVSAQGFLGGDRREMWEFTGVAAHASPHFAAIRSRRRPP